MGSQNAGGLCPRPVTNLALLDDEHSTCSEMGKVVGYRGTDHTGTNHNHIKCLLCRHSLAFQ